MSGLPRMGIDHRTVAGAVRPRSRARLPAAMLASVLLHGLGVLAFVTVSQERQATLMQQVTPENTPIEVEILADPRTGAPDAPEAEHVTEAEPQPDVPSEQVELPADPTPTEMRPPEAEPPPAEQSDLPPMPPPPPPPRAAVPAPPLPPARPRAGAAAEGRADGMTDIILGANTVPPGEDPTARNIPPRYPLDAARRGQQGAVQLRVVVGTDGAALAVDVAISSGYPFLDRAAREAVAKWRFRPGQENGLTIPATIPVTLHFSLVDSQ